MKHLDARKLWLIAVPLVAVTIAVVAFNLGRAGAQGIPGMDPLYYSGTIQDTLGTLSATVKAVFSPSRRFPDDYKAKADEAARAMGAVVIVWRDRSP